MSDLAKIAPMARLPDELTLRLHAEKPSVSPNTFVTIHERRALFSQRHIMRCCFPALECFRKSHAVCDDPKVLRNRQSARKEVPLNQFETRSQVSTRVVSSRPSDRAGSQLCAVLLMLALSGCAHREARFNQVRLTIRTGSAPLSRASSASATLQSKHLGDHPKAAIDNHFKTGHRETA